MSVKFKIGAKYKGPLINGSKKCKAVFEYVGNNQFKLLNIHPLLDGYYLNGVFLLCTEDDGSSFWDLKPFAISLENK